MLPTRRDLAERQVYTDLQEILYKKTIEYIKKDNPLSKDTSYLKQLTMFVEGRGDDGRKRALSYCNKVILQKNQDEKSSYQQIMQDVLDASEKSVLGTSKRYRRRLLEGLCMHKNALQDVEAAIIQYQRAVALNAPRAMLMITDEFRIKIMLEVLQLDLKNEKNVEMKSSN